MHKGFVVAFRRAYPPIAREAMLPPSIVQRRFIPAGAGNGQSWNRAQPSRSVHPRRSGERLDRAKAIYRADGSSPQARGTAGSREQEGLGWRFIPAGAGNGPRQKAHSSCRSVHPRRRGERLGINARGLRASGSSPQARGTGPEAGPSDDPHRFIPAGAGNGQGASLPWRGSSVHPRRRGERFSLRSAAFIISGSSPQARGTASFSV